MSPVSPAARTRAISRTATIAATALGVTAAPVSSTTKQRSASPSNARPRSAPCATTAFCRSTRFVGLERVRLVVREGAVELEVERDDLERQLRQPRGVAEHGGHGQAAHAVAGVDDHPQRADAGQVDERAQVRRRSRRARRASVTVPGSATAGNRSGVEVRLRAVADGGEAGRERDALGAGAAELDAVVGGRVVARREHRRGGVQVPGGEVRLVGRAQPDVDARRRPRADAPRAKASRELRRRVAHVVADDDLGPGRVELVDEAGGERLDDLVGQLDADQSPDVVGLDESRRDQRCSRDYDVVHRTLHARAARPAIPAGAESRSACTTHRS